MFKGGLFSLFFLVGTLNLSMGQVFIKTNDLFPESIEKPGSGTLKIFRDPAIDTLLSRYILSKRISKEPNGYRIVIYLGRERKSKDEARKIHAEFMLLYPKIPSYIDFQEPITFLVSVGNFRSKVEGTKLFMELQIRYPNAFLGRQIITYSDIDKY
jgi:hypothetical protein